MVFPAAGGGDGGWADMRSFASQVLRGRWLMVFATFILMSVSGASYSFGLYSNDIKSTLGYDQSTLNLLSFFKDLGSNVGLVSGLINEITPTWVVLSVGAAFSFCGYFMLWLAVTQKIARPKVWHMCFYIFIGGNAHTFTNTGALITCVKNFPESRGVVIGVSNGYLSLSTAIMTQFYHAFYGDDTKSLILLMASLPMAISFIFIRVIRIIMGARQPKETKVFYQFLYISLSLAGFLLIMIIVQKINIVKFTQSAYGGSVAGVLFLLFLPLAVVIKQEYMLWKSSNKATNDRSPSTRTSEIEKQNRETPPSEKALPFTSATLSQPNASAENQDSCWKTMFQKVERGEDHTILQAVFSIDMFLLFLATTCGLGGTLTVMDNLGQLGLSFGYSRGDISIFASLMSIWIYFGKILGGVVSEILLTKYKFPRTLMLTLVLLLSCAGFLLIAFSPPYALYIASIIIGFCFGAQWPLIFAIISELFGLKYYSTLYNFGVVASPVGSFLLNVKTTGYLYDREAKKQLAALGLERKPGEELNCVGGDCFKLPFILITAVTLFGTLVSLILVLRTSNFYKSDIYKKFREQVKVAEAGQVMADNNGVGLPKVNESQNTV
ncbi:hypothetical protein I3760_02G170400 [Carya illinoinensis]|uniref:Nodulin-like domain-containing protein n=1 Tax=Carya illinoinensis TaxID=32201 RepID=A0A922FWY2_CARIL|nr:hypothetical protein I3760_02G170400 [Carya illinoinensis]KAG6728320.1 hypothetical protein I3842_02G167900 [Carya illinoinensis]